MHQYLMLPLIVLLSAGLSWLFCGLVRRQLIAANRYDTPNERSLHTALVPRGGGWGIWLTFFIMAVGVHVFPVFWGFIAGRIPLVIGLAALIFISWLDDKKHISPALRICVHLFAVVMAFTEFKPDEFVFGGVFPLMLDRVIAAIAWVWFINLTNFMDGIDGVTGAEAIHISLGVIAVSLITGTVLNAAPLYALILAGAAIGFLIWNWHPAKLFMGDVGSIPLGFMLGYFLMQLAAKGYLAIALALPLYYLADATITLLKRLMRKEKVWQAHREHFYQKAALKVGHKPVLYAIIGANLVLLGLCVSSLQAGVWVLIGAPLITAILLWYLNDMAKTAPRA